MQKKSVIIYFSLIFIIFLFIGYYYYSKSLITEESINEFIEKENLNQVSIQKLSNKEYYLFSPSQIYIYRGPDGYTKSPTSNIKNILIGGLQKGSVGLIVKNNEVLNQGRTYLVEIDGKSREYEYSGEKYLIIKDFRIWNPVPQIKIKFLNDQEEVIFETEY
ncbi:hypothetical protein [Paenibacillus illinoisensis]|uniref:hypothetical protein n=1 Tax=Paenibacillus illinoisensis TaxID=59845 RepID=UPI001C8D2E2A|nr:hypothetical protein [Paenibacillus illinoisensis]MBY0217924.1 hypothetical protein [Paenibacillus illinoisensis]